MNARINAVEIEGLTKSYGLIKAVDHLDLCVGKGEIFGFLGPNGAGKTTTLKMLAGLTKPDSGKIFIMGEEANFGGGKGRHKLGYLPDVPECYGYMNSTEFLTLGAELVGLPTKEIKPRVGELIELVGLSGIKKRIGSFSRGMKQRIGIAQALINSPDVVLMDEPVSALDPEGRFDVIEILQQLKGKTTVFFSTHIISDIERVCDSVAIISKGKLLEQGKVADLKAKYDNSIVSVSLPNDTDFTLSEQFIDRIKTMEWTVSVQVLSPMTYKIKVNNRIAAQVNIPRILSQTGIALESMDSVSISLEDVFLEVTRR